MRAPKNYVYFSNCVHLNGQDIEEMVDQAIDITWRTFRQYVNLEHLKELYPFNYYDWKPGKGDGGLRLKDDWAVSYHRSWFRGVRCYYIQHSGIEYVFLPGA